MLLTNRVFHYLLTTNQLLYFKINRTIKIAAETQSDMLRAPRLWHPYRVLSRVTNSLLTYLQVVKSNSPGGSTHPAHVIGRHRHMNSMVRLAAVLWNQRHWHWFLSPSNRSVCSLLV